MLEHTHSVRVYWVSGAVDDDDASTPKGKISLAAYAGGGQLRNDGSSMGGGGSLRVTSTTTSSPRCTFTDLEPPDGDRVVVVVGGASGFKISAGSRACVDDASSNRVLSVSSSSMSNMMKGSTGTWGG